MKKSLFLKTAFLVLVGVGVAIPHQALAAAKTQTQATVQDVKLGQNGTLTGFAVDSQGNPDADQTVKIMQGRTVIADLKTDSKGRFETKGVKGGVYQIQSAKGDVLYRAWADGTAPKSSKDYAVVGNSKRVVRGQEETLGLLNLSNTGGLLLVGGSVAGGVVSIVRYEDKKDDAKAAEARANALQMQLDQLNQTP